MMLSTSGNDRADLYYRGLYWNDLPEIREHLNLLSTGDLKADWIARLEQLKLTPGHGLILNCGNGWVERELMDRGILTKATAIDISQTLIDQAVNSQGNRNITYIACDINNFEFEPRKFDFVINYAAMHHTQLIDRTLRGVAHSLRPTGLLISWDYTGPHRNQYPIRMYEEAWKVNELLPKDLKSELSYPHLPTMLASDPTEAIHSELFLEVHLRYFDVLEAHPLGGAIAYPILTHNPGIHSASVDTRRPYLEKIIKEDLKFTNNKLENSLFAFIISKPGNTPAESKLREWELEEILRENKASEVGYYYPETLLQFLTNSISDLKDLLGQSNQDPSVGNYKETRIFTKLMNLKKLVAFMIKFLIKQKLHLNKLSRSEIIFVYRELLNREVESEEIIKQHLVNHGRIFGLISEIYRSVEFTGRHQT